MPEPVWLKHFKEGWLWEEMGNPNEEIGIAKLKVVIGGFYEVLAAQILKGEHGRCPQGWDVYPDVVLWGMGRRGKAKCDVLVEVKGGSRKYGFIIDHGQLREYDKLEAYEFPFSNPVTYYMLFVHNVVGMGKENKSLDEILDMLCSNTVGAILIPKSMVKVWVECSPMRMYTYVNESSRGGLGHEYFSRMTGTKVEKWLHSPKEFGLTLEEMAKDGKYDWSMNGNKLSSRFILNQEVMGKKVSPFLLTVVQDGHLAKKGLQWLTGV